MEKRKIGTYTLEKYTAEEATRDFACYTQKAGNFVYMYMLYKEMENGNYGYSSEEVIFEYKNGVLKYSECDYAGNCVKLHRCADMEAGIRYLLKHMWQW